MPCSTCVLVKAPLIPDVAFVELPPKKPNHPSAWVFGLRHFLRSSIRARLTYLACQQLPHCHQQDKLCARRLVRILPTKSAHFGRKFNGDVCIGEAGIETRQRLQGELTATANDDHVSHLKRKSDCTNNWVRDATKGRYYQLSRRVSRVMMVGGYGEEEDSKEKE